MNGQYVQADLKGLKTLADSLEKAGRGALKKEMAAFLDAAGMEMLRIIEEEIVRVKAVDTRLLLNSFHKGAEGNVYTLSEGSLTLEVGTNVEYAKWVNDGHWTIDASNTGSYFVTKNGELARFVPGSFNGDGKFRYSKGAKTGMVIKQKFVEGKHYMEHSIRIMEKMFPKLVERKLPEWIEKHISGR